MYLKISGSDMSFFSTLYSTEDIENSRVWQEVSLQNRSDKKINTEWYRTYFIITYTKVYKELELNLKK